jgi:hypothetical protein
MPPNGLNRDSRWPMSPRSSIGYVKNDFLAYDTFSTNRATILHQDLHYLQMDRNKLPLEPRHLVVPSGASKMISEPMVRLVQTVHLSCTDTNNVSKWIETRFHIPKHLGVPLGASKTIYEPMVCSTQTMHLSCVKISTISKWTNTSF